MLRSTTERALLRSLLASLLLWMALLSACTTASDHPTVGPRYIGRGSGTTPLAALGEAKVSAVYQAAVAILGQETAAVNRSRIEAAVRRAENPNAFVYNQTLKILNTGGDPIRYEVEIGVNLAALRATLAGLGLEPPSSGEAGSRGAPSTTPGSSVARTPQPELTARVRRYLDRMTYMASFSPDTALDPFFVRSATASADAYLADNGIPYVDASQVEALRRDQATLYEQETGRSIGITQWIAQRLRADVYIVIDGSVNGSSSRGRHYGSADVTLRIFETSTGSGMGAANFSSIQPSVSLNSEREAVLNALQSSVYQAMEAAVGQARAALARELASGITYDLIILNSGDDRAMRAFARSLALRTEDVRLVSWSRDETRYRVTLSGSANDLQDIVYETSQAVPGFNGMGLVTLRGRELTFDTGT